MLLVDPESEEDIDQHRRFIFYVDDNLEMSSRCTIEPTKINKPDQYIPTSIMISDAKVMI